MELVPKVGKMIGLLKQERWEIRRRYFRAVIGTHETSQICGVQVA